MREEKTVKKIIFKRLLPIILTAVMLLSVALPVFGASISAPNEEEPYYTVVFEDGILTVRLNPDKVYEVLRDGELSREELKKFIPEDILNTLSDGDGLSVGKLASLAANYVSADDLVEIYNMVPAEVFFEYFDISILTEIVTLDELLGIVDVDGILSGISDDDIKSLINDDAFKLLLTDKVKDTILTDEFIENLLKDGSIVSEIANDKELHDALKKLVDDGVIAEMLADAAIKNAIIKLAESGDTLDKILNDKGADILDPSDDAVTLLKDYMLSHTEKINTFVNDPFVIEPLKNSETIRQFLETHVKVEDVIDFSDVNDDYIDQFMEDYDITAENLQTNAAALGITADEIMKYTSFSELISDEAIHLEKLREVYGITDDILKQDAEALGITVDKIFNYVSLDDIIDDNIIKIDVFCDLYGITEDSLKQNADALGFTDEELGQLSSLEELIKKVAEKGKTDVLRELYPNITDESLKANAAALGMTAGNIVKYADFAYMINERVINLDKLCELRGITIASLSENADKLEIDVKEVMKYVDLKELIESDAVDLKKFHDTYKVSMSSLIENGYLTDSDVAHLVLDEWEEILNTDGMLAHIIDTVGLHAIFEDFGRDELVGVLGGYYGLIERGYFSEEEVIRAIGSIGNETATDDDKLIAGYKKLIDLLLPEKLDDIVDIVGYDRWKEYIVFADVLDAAGKAAGKAEGDYSDLARLYSVEQLAKIARAIGIRNIIDFARDNDIHEKVDVKATLRDILDLARSKKDKIEPFARKVASCVSSFVTNEISVMKLNGKQIYKNGSFDLQAIVTATAQAIPDIDKFLEMESGDVFCQLILSTEVRGEPFTAGFAIEFIGDLTRLQNLAKSRADYFRLNVTDELDVTAEVVIPAVASELYMRGLNSAKVPARLKTKILQFPTMTVADMNALLRGLSDEEISDYSAEIMEKADEIKAKVYAELDERIGKDSEKLAAAKRKADEIIDKFSDPKKLSALRDKGVSALDKLSDKMGDVTVSEIYKGSGVFAFDRGFSTDLWALANKVVTLPEELLILFDNDMTLTGSLDMTMTVNGLYKATITDGDGIRSEYFLPAGISMSVLNKYTSVAYAFTDEKMPAHDVSFVHEDLYALEFYDVNGALIERIGYTESTDPDPSLYPAVPQKEGYTGVWESFTLRSEETIKVYPVYTANEYTAKYVADGSTYTSTFTVETRKLKLPLDEKLGYRFNGWAVDVDDDGTVDTSSGDFFLISDGEGNYLVPDDKTLPARDIRILSDHSIIDYTITFIVDGEEYDKTSFNAENRTVKLPDVAPTPEAKHIFEGWYLDTDEDGAGDELITDSLIPPLAHRNAYARFKRVGYTATFEPVGDFGGTVIDFKLDDTELKNVPAVPEKEGYKDGAWYVRLDGADDVPLSECTLGASDITLYAKYTPITYTIQFVVGSEIIDTVSFDLENGLERDPLPVPSKTGYTAAWADFTIKPENMMVSAVYTPIKYTASFVVDGEVKKSIEFTVETEKLEGVPDVPEKLGYTGKWKDYTLGAADITIEAEYTIIVYKAEFMADGVLVSTVTFTVNDSSITEPDVPFKEGYEGKWESYTLGASDIVINAVYTEIPTIVVNPDARTMGTFWWILLATIIMMLIIWIISKNAEEQNEPEPTPEAASTPVAEPEPEAEPETEEIPEPEAEPELVESVDVETADKLMSDEKAAEVIETVGGAGVGAKAIINISAINEAFSDGDVVDIEALKAKKLIPAKTQRIKVLADGTLDKALTVYAEQFSVQAIKMITLTGGKVIQKK